MLGQSGYNPANQPPPDMYQHQSSYRQPYVGSSQNQYHNNQVNGYGPYPPQQPSSQQPPVPSSPLSDADAATRAEDETRIRNAYPRPSSKCYTFKDHVYELKVVQQPQRARMCGYGDRDRRPISAPPIVQLIIRKKDGLKEIDYESPEINANSFVAKVDIFDIEGKGDKGVIKGSPTQNSISQSQLGGFTVTQASHHPSRIAQPFQFRDGPDRAPDPTMYPMPKGGHGYSAGSYTGRDNSYPPPNHQVPYSYAPQTSPYGQPARPQLHPSNQMGPHHQPAGYPPAVPHHPVPQAPPTPPAEMSPPGIHTTFSRNLIGHTITSGYCLRDLDDKVGIFFIFNDLSVRIEDWFRLKCQVFNVAESIAGMTEAEIIDKAKANNAAPSEIQPEDAYTQRGSKSLEGITHSFIPKSAPCLAECYTDCFKVYSAKKFPGVAESTSLSKCFAKQGVKISIRKDNERDGRDKKKTGDKRKRSEAEREEDDDDGAYSD